MSRHASSRPTRLPRVYAIIPGLLPSAMILVLKPFFELERRGLVHFEFGTGARWSEKALLGCDVLLVLRGNALSDLRALRLAERHAIPAVYDIDDNFHEISPATSVGQALRSARSIAVVERFFRGAAAVRVYNPLMRELALKCGARRAPVEKVYFHAPPGISSAPAHISSGTIRILYASARRGSEREEAAMAEALASIARRHGTNVEIVLWKGLGAKGPRGPNVRIEEAVPDYTGFLHRLAELRPAIGLAPLGGDRFFLSKTNNKYREYGGLGIPAVYSRTALYEASVIDGHNGLLVGETAAEWERAIERLLGDAALRESIMRNAVADVADNYDFESFLHRWLACLEELPLHTARACRQSTPGRPTVSVVGSGWQRAPISQALATILAGLGASLVRRDSLQQLTASDVFIYAPTAGEAFPAWRTGHGVVDLTLVGGVAPSGCRSERARFVVMAGSAATVDPAIEVLPDPATHEGRFDATGTDARLMPIAECLLDRAPILNQPFKRRAHPERSHVRHNWRRLRTHLMERSREAGEALDERSLPRPSTIVRIVVSDLRLRIRARLYEQRLRRSRQL